MDTKCNKTENLPALISSLKTRSIEVRQELDRLDKEYKLINQYLTLLEQDYSLAQINNNNSQYSSQVTPLFSNQVSQTSQFRNDWSWAEKAIYALEKGSPNSLTCSDIVDIIISDDNTVSTEDKESRRIYMKRISAVLSALVSKRGKKVQRQQNAKGEYEYRMK